MDNSIHEKLIQAKAYLDRREFNECMAVLAACPPDDPEVENLAHKCQQGKQEELGILLNAIQENLAHQKMDAALEFSRKAQTLAPDDSRVQSAGGKVQNALSQLKQTEELAKEKQKAKNLLTGPAKSIDNLETAIRILNNVLSKATDDLDANNLLTDANRERSEFLRKKGLVATLEQAEEFQEALQHIEHLIEKKYAEYEGQDIYTYRSNLEKKAREFAEIKAAKYSNAAEKEMSKNPRLALRFIEQAFVLKGLGTDRIDELNALKFKAAQKVKKLEQAEMQLKDAVTLINNQDYQRAIAMLEPLENIPGISDVGTRLELAKKYQKDQIIKDAKLKLVVLESSMDQTNFQEAKSEILQVMNTLVANDPQIEILRTKCTELLGEIQNREHKEKLLEVTLAKATKLMEDKEFSTARDMLSHLDKELQKHAEIKTIFKKLSRIEDIDEALHKTREAFETEDYEQAWEQIKIIKNRDRTNEEIKKLHRVIESAYKYHTGLNALNAGLMDKAKRAFKHVLKLDGEYCDDAREHLKQIDEDKELNRQAEKILKEAQKCNQKMQYQKAYQTLNELEDIPQSIKKEVSKLLSETRDKWRKELVTLIKTQLKQQLYDSAIQTAEQLKDVMLASDSEMLNKVHLNYHIHHAQLAEKNKDWTSAGKHWEEAQKYDINDEGITVGLQVSQKHQCMEAASKLDSREAVAVLESALEKHTNQLTDLDYKLEEQLYRRYMENEDFDRALALAGTRLNEAPKFATKAATVRETCRLLTTSDQKFRGGSYQESLNCLLDCLDQYKEYSDIIDDYYRKRKSKIIETLLNEAAQLEIDEANDVHTLGKYKEILHYEPEHRKAKEKHQQLLARFKRSISETLYKGIELEENENAETDELEELIHRIEQMMPIAPADQKTKLQYRLDKLEEKNRYMHNLNRKLKQIRGFLNDARETGDFTTIDIELNDDTIKKASERNRKLRMLTKEVKDLKERRKKCQDMVARLKNAFEELDFQTIERTVTDIRRLDEDDEFCIRQNIKLEDSFSEQVLGFDELKDWSKSRRGNLTTLSVWLDTHQTDTLPFEEEEQKLREKCKASPGTSSIKEIIKGLQKLATLYRGAAQRLTSPPESPLSTLAEKITKDAGNLVTTLSQKAEQLETEVKEIQAEEAKVKEFVDKAAEFINMRKYARAQPFVDEGLALAPAHPTLRHYRGIIQDELS